MGGLITVLGSGYGLVTKLLPVLTNLFKFIGFGSIGWGTAIAGVVVGVIALSKAIKDANPSIEELQQNIEDSNTQLEINKQRLEEISEIPWYERTPEIIDEKEAIEKENVALQNNIDLWSKKKQKQVDKQAQEVISGGVVGFETIDWSSSDDLLSKLHLTVEEYNRYIDEGLIKFSAFDENIHLVGEAYSKYLIGEIERYNDILNEQGYLTDKQIKEYNNIKQQAKELADAYDQQGEANSDLIESLIRSILAYDALTTEQKNQAQIDEEQIESIEELVISTTNYVDVLKELSSASNDINKYGVVTSETLKSISELFPELVNNGNNANTALFNVDGTLTALGNDAYDSELGVQTFIKGLIEAEAQSMGFDLSELISTIDSTGISFRQATLEALGFSSTIEALEAGVDVGTIFPRVESLINQYTQLGIGTQAPSGGGSSKQEDTRLEALKKTVSLLESELNLLQKQNASVDSQREKYLEIQNALHEQAEYLRSINGDQEDINELSSKWWDIQDKINDTYDDDLGLLESQLNLLEATEGTEDQQIAILQQISATYLQQISYLESIGASQISINELKLKELQIQQQIQGIVTKQQETQAEAEQQAIQNRIDAIQTLANYMQDYADSQIAALEDQIDAIQEQNDELEKQIELEEKLDALSKSKQQQVMVYKDGRFQYVGDADAISSATGDLEAYYREQETNKQVAAIQEEIDKIQEWKDAWGAISDEEQRMLDEQSVMQELGIDLANENLDKLLTQANYWGGQIVNSVSGITNAIFGGSRVKSKTSSSDDKIASVQGTTPTQWAELAYKGSSYYVDKAKSVAAGQRASNTISILAGGVEAGLLTQKDAANVLNEITSRQGIQSNTSKFQELSEAAELFGSGDYLVGKERFQSSSAGTSRYAKGTRSAKGGLSLVGEQGAELRIINQGDAILPANITQNLWDWGSINPVSALGRINDTSMSVTIQNLNLPNVVDGQGFVSYLKSDFFGDIMQFAH